MRTRSPAFLKPQDSRRATLFARAILNFKQSAAASEVFRSRIWFSNRFDFASLRILASLRETMSWFARVVSRAKTLRSAKTQRDKTRYEQTNNNEGIDSSCGVGHEALAADRRSH